MIKLVDGIASSLILIHVGKVLKRWHWKEGVAPVATTTGGSGVGLALSEAMQREAVLCALCHSTSF